MKMIGLFISFGRVSPTLPHAAFLNYSEELINRIDSRESRSTQRKEDKIEQNLKGNTVIEI